MTPALRLDGLTAGHMGVPCVRDLSLVVQPGEIVALLGPNGAGKTTTLDTIAGVLPPIAGSAEVYGQGVRSPRHASRRGVGYLPEGRGLFGQLTVRENVCLRARGRREADRVLEGYPALEAVADRRAGLLSGGEQQILALACALATRPRLLLVDEMTMGLAPLVVEHLVALVRAAAASGIAVLFVEQHVHVALTLASRAYVLRQGQVVLSSTSDDLRARLPELHDSYFDRAADVRGSARPSGPT